MSAGSIPANLRPYLPSTMLQADGVTLKPGIDADKAAEVAKGVQAKAGALPPAEARLFLAMVAGADLAPNGKLPADLEKTLDAFVATASQVQTLAISGNALDFLARVMIEQSAEQRKDALNDRLAARSQAKSELLDQAGKLKDSAEKMSSSALTSMIVTVVMSAVAIAGSVASVVGTVGGAMKNASAMKEMTGDVGKLAPTMSKVDAGTAAAKMMKAGAFTSDKVETLANSAQRFNVAAQVGSQVSQTANQIGGGVSNYTSTVGQADAKNLEAQGSESAAKAQETQAIGDVRKEQQQALDQMVQSIIQFLKDLKEAKAQQMQALTRV